MRIIPPQVNRKEYTVNKSNNNTLQKVKKDSVKIETKVEKLAKSWVDGEKPWSNEEIGNMYYTYNYYMKKHKKIISPNKGKKNI